MDRSPPRTKQGRLVRNCRKAASPRTSVLAGVALLVAQTASALSDPQSPADSANDPRDTDFRYGADYNGLDITRPEKASVEMRLEDRTSGIAKSVDAQALLLRGGGAVALSAGWKFGWLSDAATRHAECHEVRSFFRKIAAVLSVAYLDRDSDGWWVCSYSVPPRDTVVTDGYHFAGCLFTTSSLMSAPQPGFVSMIRWRFSMRGGSVTRSSFQGTSSMSTSMMRKFGIAAQKWALISVEMWP